MSEPQTFFSTDPDLHQYGPLSFVRVSPYSGLTAQDVGCAFSFLGVQL